MTVIKSLCVFCGAQDNVAQHFLDMGARFGAHLANNNVRMIYGGGDFGIVNIFLGPVTVHYREVSL